MVPLRRYEQGRSVKFTGTAADRPGGAAPDAESRQKNGPYGERLIFEWP
jgi:hypothetical protein